MQFLVEAVTLSVFGGVVGIALGLGIAYTAVTLMSVPFVATAPLIVLAFAFSPRSAWFSATSPPAAPPR